MKIKVTKAVRAEIEKRQGELHHQTQGKVMKSSLIAILLVLACGCSPATSTPVKATRFSTVESSEVYGFRARYAVLRDNETGEEYALFGNQYGVTTLKLSTVSTNR